MPIALDRALDGDAGRRHDRAQRAAHRASTSTRCATQRVGLEQLTRELREATSFRFLTSQLVEFDAYVRTSGTGTLRKIRYDCSSGTHCVRQEGPVGGAVSGNRIIIDALENPDVFEPEPDFVNPRYVGIVARVRIADDRRLITLRDGVDLRNLTSRF